MYTPSHWLIGAGIAGAGKFDRGKRSAFLWGSVAPDIAIYIAAIVSWVYLFFVDGLNSKAIFHLVWDDWFFNDPLWIASYNALHSPVAIIVCLLFAFKLRKGYAAFFCACLIHSVIDILTHHNDGPLLFFPFEWSIRFYSPVSYWDVNHHAVLFGYFEWSLNAVIIVYLLKTRFLKRNA